MTFTIEIYISTHNQALHKSTSMPFIEGVGDELVYAAIFAAPLVFIYWSSFGGVPEFLRKATASVRVWVSGVWNTILGRQVPEISSQPSNSTLLSMDVPQGNDCCSICHDDFTLPCQANCAHWFCGDCILRVWQHSSALHPCKCPICRRPITLLIPSNASIQHQEEMDSERILREIAKYNRIFGGGPVSFLQRVRDMPLLLRRMVWELLDPQRAIFLVHRTRIILLVALSMCYVFSPLDILPEAMLGLIGLLDDVLVVMIVLFYLAMLYRSTLVLQHGGRA